MNVVRTAAALSVLLGMGACGHHTGAAVTNDVPATVPAEEGGPTAKSASAATTPESAHATGGAISTAAAPAAAAPNAAQAIADDSTVQPSATPDVTRMKLAKPVGKSTVPVDVRYTYTGKPAKNQSASLQLAFIPRVQGSALRVEFPRTEAVSVSETEELNVQKAAPLSVHRHNLVVTPLKANAEEIRALVSMDVDGGRYFGIFVIPVGSPAP
jgi:hypothetical protein